MDKRDLKDIKVPKNLDNVIEKSFKRARNDKRKFIKRGMAAVIGFGVFTGGIVALPTLAENFPVIEKALERFGIEKDTSLARYIGQEKELDGITFKIEELIYTEHKIVVAISATSPNKLNKNDYTVDIGLSELENVKSSGSHTSSYNEKENKVVYYHEMTTAYNINPTANLNINIVENPKDFEKAQSLKSVAFKVKVNEKKSFNETEELIINNDYKFKFNKYESYLMYKEQEEESEGVKAIKVGNEYKPWREITRSSERGTLWGDIEYSKEEIEKAKSIDIISLVKKGENLRWEENVKYVEEQGIKFPRENKFENGTVGTVINLKREGNKVEFKYKTDPRNLYNLLWSYILRVGDETGGMSIYPTIIDEGKGIYRIVFDGVLEEAKLEVGIMTRDEFKLLEKEGIKIK